MGFLYNADARDRAIFDGLEYCGPETFSQGSWHNVAIVKCTNGGGHDVVIQECRLPARFWRLHVLPSKTYDGKPLAGWAMSTGSGDDMGRLIVQMALAIAGGMLSMNYEGDNA